MPLVTASEEGTEQTELAGDESVRMWSCRTWVFSSSLNRSSLERDTLKGDSPVE